MSLDLLRKLRLVSLGSLFAASTLLGGCGSAPNDDVVETGEGSDDITQVDHTKVKRQSIGNCWLYATASWYEALHKMATGKEVDTSESYLTYWHWYEQITNGSVRNNAISTGGSYGTAVELIVRYGLMMENDFIPTEGGAEMSNRQASALAAINTELASGELKELSARRDRAKVRAILDKAWGLSPTVVESLNTVFGPSVSKTIDRSWSFTAPPATTKIIRSKDFTVKLRDVRAGTWTNGTLADAIGTRGSSFWSPRVGKFAWNEVDYPFDSSSRREFQKRVQRALHDGQPVVISWFVDFNALSDKATFTLEELARRGGPGRQGGHMTVLHDYQAENVPGFGTLEAGKPATPEAMNAALGNDVKITFFRVKNSWGSFRPDRWKDAVVPGYHDLYTTYLNGPVKKCGENPDGSTNTSSCTSNMTPLWSVVLPAGY